MERDSLHGIIQEMFRLDTPAWWRWFFASVVAEGERMEREGLIETIRTSFGDIRVVRHPLLTREGNNG